MKKEPIQERTNTLVYIDIDKIRNHPDNPRKDLGDLTELAESIKVNGILQNLTVVPEEPGYCQSCTLYIPGAGKCRDGHDKGARPPCGKWEGKGTFLSVIGNRRLAAAKLAGLTSAPCIVSGMDRQEQIRTMLMENIQRADLTVYEQAKGFQMMIDLGDTIENVAGKTGFSESTIRRRTKLLELDPKKFKESEERGATLFDYMELDKIQNAKRKNKVLESIGTDNFKSELKKAVDEEAAEERKARWIAALSAFATQVDSDSGYTYAKYYSTYNEPNVERPDDADTVDYFFVVEKYGSIRLLKESTATNAPQKSAEEVERERRKKELQGQLAEITNRAYELRKEFASSVSTTCAKKHLAEILAFDLWVQIDKCCNVDDDDIMEALGIQLHEAENDEDEDEELTYDMVLAATTSAPEKALWRIAYANMDDDKNEGYFNSWRLEHCENDCLDRLYALLVKMGYKMSDEEKATQDGTHELFKKEQESDTSEGGDED